MSAVEATLPEVERALAAFALGPAPADLPDDAGAATKLAILDCLGVLVAGSASPGTDTVAGAMAGWGGAAQATLFRDGRRVPAPNAAFANAATARALDYDDVHEAAVCHTSAAVVPTAIAMAELTGETDGRRLVAAVAVGRELLCRLSLANQNRAEERTRSHNYPFNAMACAAVAARYLGLDERATVDAMGLTYGQSMSSRQGVIEGRLSVRVHQGMAAWVGITCALLARGGITGPRAYLSGKYGYYAAYEHGRLDEGILLGGLGSTYASADSSIKRYPCCMQSHTAIEAALRIRAEHGLTAGDVSTVRVGMNEDAYHTVVVPEEGRYDPRSVADIQFSAPWVVAASLVTGRFGLAELSEAAMRDPATRSLAPRVECYVDHDIDARSAGRISPAVVEITTRGGSYVDTAEPAQPGAGAPDPRPIVEKFADCLANAPRPVDPAVRERLATGLLDLDRVDDVRPLIEMLRLAAPWR